MENIYPTPVVKLLDSLVVQIEVLQNYRLHSNDLANDKIQA